jgi:hypothetical protein
MLNRLRRFSGWTLVAGWALVFASLPAPLLRDPSAMLPDARTPVWLIAVMAPVTWANPWELTSILFPVPDLCLLASPLLYWMRPRRPLVDAVLRAASAGLLLPWLLAFLPREPVFHVRSGINDLMWGYCVFSAGCTLIFLACAVGRPVLDALGGRRGLPVAPLSAGVLPLRPAHAVHPRRG